MGFSTKNFQQGCVIFDMDGVLIDSEPLWWQAEVEVFRSIGVPLDLEMCKETTGLRMDAAVDYWFHKFPWKTKSLLEVENEVKEIVCKLIIEKGVAKPGAISLIRELEKFKTPMAICSSSSLKIIKKVCEILKITDAFQVLQTAEDCIHGKPHPDPYLTTAKCLNAFPSQCVVIEDSLIGAISGKSAGMKVIAVPEKHNFNKTIFDFCDAKFQSLELVRPEYIIHLLNIRH
jgi:mannitol-1-/sugar-/sorbitol-6-/2-deoxyglucose-6-phosphatase